MENRKIDADVKSLLKENKDIAVWDKKERKKSMISPKLYL